MNTTPDFDRHAAAWLADGPTELNDRVLDAALAQVHGTKQRRRPTAIWRVGTMSRVLNLAALALGLVAMTGVIAFLRSGAQVGWPVGGSTPEVFVPPGARPSMTVDGLIDLARAQNAANEQGLGRAIAPFRVLRVRLLQAGDTLVMFHRDGTISPDRGAGPRTGGVYRADRPTWVVETVGTFYAGSRGLPVQEPAPSDGVAVRGLHGFYFWADDLSADMVEFYPCWNRLIYEPPLSAAEYDGSCP